jgi:hypothetical protein
MKQLLKSGGYKTIAIFLILSLIQIVSFGQDSGSSSQNTSSQKTTSTTTTTWYTQPWVWIVGGVVVLIILVALLRGNSTSDTHTTVVKTERDI